MIKGISGGQKKRLTTGLTIVILSLFRSYPLIFFPLLIPCFLQFKVNLKLIVKSHYPRSGELLVGPARVLLMDEISTGLDSSTTYQIIKYLRHSTQALDGTTIISLLQPAPETFELFDDIILISEGQIVYQGPRIAALDFFAGLGFRCPERKNVADFLQEVSDFILSLVTQCILEFYNYTFYVSLLTFGNSGYI